MIELRFTYSKSIREQFREGTLWRTWAKRYPHLFDEDDVRIQRNQPNNHFVEWLAAVLLYESTGYLSLVEKYDSPRHPKKIEPYRSRVPENVQVYLRDELAGGHPDLFVYDPEGTDWYFCEVKSHTDRVRDCQLRCWDVLESMSGRDVRLLTFTRV